MERGEWVITLLGLVATYCLPWPGAQPEHGRQPAVQTGVAAPTPTGAPGALRIYAGAAQPTR